MYPECSLNVLFQAQFEEHWENATFEGKESFSGSTTVRFVKIGSLNVPLMSPECSLNVP
jgi:hypothetical protein